MITPIRFITKIQTHKNAHEIRLELLNLAHSDCWNAYHEKLNVLRENDNRAMEDYYRKLEGNSSTPLPKLSFTSEAIDELVPCSNAVKKRAAELYTFVEGF